MPDGLLRAAGRPENFSGSGGILDQLSARCINRALEAELEINLERRLGEKPSEDQGNRRNGRTSKKVRTKSGCVRIEMPRDRDGSSYPALVPKHKRSLGRFDDTIIALYARVVSQRDICQFMEESYCVEVDPGVMSRATDAVIEDVKLWQQRPLEATYIAV